MTGDPEKLAYYRTFADRAEPDAYEATLPEVFPDIAPGSFTYVEELNRWVWTTFNEFQWDLDYTNPAVFRAMAEAMLGLANAGVDVLRLDAVPFLWKRKGTDSQNQPEVHELLQAFRAAMRIAAPGVAFKAEAIVSPRELVRYLGAGRHEGKECDLAYHNVLMVLGWSALASGTSACSRARCRRCRRSRRRRVGDLRALPRRHRLGDHGGGRRARRRGRAPAPPLPQGLLRGRVPRHVRSRRALPARPAVRRGAHERERGVAGGAGGGARRARGGARDPPHPAAARARVRPRRPAADLHGRRARPAQRPALGGRPRARRRQPLDAPPADGLGGGGAPPRPGHGRGADLGRDAGAGDGARGTRAAHAQGSSEPLFTSNPHVFALLREHAGERLLLLANFTPLEQAVHGGVVRDRGLQPEAECAGTT